MSLMNLPDEKTILRREVQVWSALVAGDAVADGAALCDRFLGIYADGFAGKADHVAQLAGGPTVQSFDITQTQFRALGPDHAVLSYRATFTRVGKDTSEVMFVTSIWERQEGAWMNILSQDTSA